MRRVRITNIVLSETPLRSLVFACFFAVSALVVSACGEEFEPEDPCPGTPDVACDADPWNCDAGQTCWFNAAGDGMQCLNSGPAQEGMPCEPAIGSPTCGDRMLCVGDGSGSGTCRAYCEPTMPCKACEGAFVCTGVSFTNQATGAIVTMTNLCLPP